MVVLPELLPCCEKSAVRRKLETNLTSFWIVRCHLGGGRIRNLVLFIHFEVNCTACPWKHRAQRRKMLPLCKKCHKIQSAPRYNVCG